MYLPYKQSLVPFARKLRKKETLAETVFWNRIRGKKILGYKFTRQKPLLKYIADFYCAELMLVIEIDGSFHCGDRIDKDRIRTEELKSIGISVKRYLNDEVYRDIDLVISNLIAYIRVYEGLKSFEIEKNVSRETLD